MLRNVKAPRVRKPVMVMLHGSGSSAAILGIQSHALAKELSKTYDLVFVDGPAPSAPGPGVLPLFADMPGYHRWLAPGAVALSQAQRLAELLDVARYLEAQLAQQGVRPAEVVAMLGFSQGALVALAMQGLSLAGQTPWEALRFVVAIGAGTTGNATQMDGIGALVGLLSGLLGSPAPGKYPGHAVHAVGTKDLWYKDGRRIVAMCDPQTTRAMDYRDGHVVPRLRPDVLKLVGLVAAVDQASRAAHAAAPPARAAARSALLAAMPPMVTGSDVTTGMAVLAANGIQI